MSKSRDRHARGLRGPMALPNPLTGGPVRIRRRPRPGEFFVTCVGEAVTRIGRQCPGVLESVEIGIEDVPTLEGAWSRDRVPLAAALEATADRPSQVIIYRRPLEHRAASRKGLRILVYRTIVEQLSALTGMPVSEIDPEGLAADDDWGE